MDAPEGKWMAQVDTLNEHAYIHHTLKTLGIPSASQVSSKRPYNLPRHLPQRCSTGRGRPAARAVELWAAEGRVSKGFLSLLSCHRQLQNTSEHHSRLLSSELGYLGSATVPVKSKSPHQSGLDQRKTCGWVSSRSRHALSHPGPVPLARASHTPAAKRGTRRPTRLPDLKVLLSLWQGDQTPEKEDARPLTEEKQRMNARWAIIGE